MSIRMCRFARPLPCALALLLAAPALPAQTAGPNAGGNAAALERQFWRCDHAASHTRLDAATAQHCSQVSERLLATRFAGDLDAMLVWWRANKPAQHAAIGAGPR